MFEKSLQERILDELETVVPSSFISIYERATTSGDNSLSFFESFFGLKFIVDEFYFSVVLHDLCDEGYVKRVELANENLGFLRTGKTYLPYESPTFSIDFAFAR